MVYIQVKDRWCYNQQNQPLNNVEYLILYVAFTLSFILWQVSAEHAVNWQITSSIVSYDGHTGNSKMTITLFHSRQEGA